MRTIQLTLAYDGTRYAGWQIQPNRMAIQQIVEQAIVDLTGERVKVAASGRTDAGVHALAQIATFNSGLNISLDAYRHGLITRLPADIVVTSVIERPVAFHARFDAVRKTYRYVIHISRVPSPWLTNYVWWLRSPLNVAAMQAAADSLIGTHDFRSFETQWPNRTSSVRTVFEARWQTCAVWQPWATPADHTPASDVGPFLIFDISADGFLYNMVRTIVGTLVPVGRSRRTPDDVLRILESGDRRLAGDTAPACGLYLSHVETELNETRLKERRSRLHQWQLSSDSYGDNSLDGVS